MELIRSTITLITELLLTCAVVYIFIEGYKKNVFHKKLALTAVLYETIFNISYMAHQTIEKKAETAPAINHPPYYIFLAIFHGTLSLLMFVGLVAFLGLAYFKYKKGINFFKTYPKISIVFLILWFTSVISGVLFYFTIYFVK